MSYGQHGGSTSAITEPLHTITASRKDQNTLVAAFLAQHNTGVVGHDARAPVSTLTSVPTQQQLVTLPLADTVNGSDRSEQVWAFLSQYYGNETDQDVRDPLRTVTTKDRFGLVTGHITDISMRMLSTRELFAAQGFPENYRINVTNPVTGKQLNKSEQTRCVGNSVCPQVAAALVAANVPELTANEAPQRRQQMELVGI
jgi:DNA (cytosine-5)-methyltransferase 1